MKKPLIISLVAVVLLVAIVFFGLNRQQQYQPKEFGKTIADFETRIQQVNRFVLTKRRETVHLSLKEDTWVLEESANFPVKISELRTLITAIDESEKLEKRSSNTENYQSYGLGEEVAGYITALDSDNNQLFKLAVGSRMSQLEGWYGVIGDDPQVWVINGDLNINVSPTHWLVSDVVDLATTDITSIQLGDAMLKSDNGNLVVDNIGDKKPDQANINQLSGALSGLNLLDVSSQKPADISGDTSKVTYVTSYGLIVNIERVLDTQQNNWIQLNATTDKEKVVGPDNTADTVDSLFARAEEQSNELNEKFGGYWLKIPSLAGNALGYGFDNLLKKEEPEEKKQPEKK